MMKVLYSLQQIPGCLCLLTVLVLQASFTVDVGAGSVEEVGEVQALGGAAAHLFGCQGGSGGLLPPRH